MSKCIGCGSILQDINPNEDGYVSCKSNNLCERCFRIRNYNEYKIILKDNCDYINILKQINKTDSLVLLVVDVFNISKNISDISKYINNKILLVLTKRDILPKSCNDEKIISYFKNYKLNIIDTVLVSSFKNYNVDSLYEKINYYKNNNNVYVVGFTNSGKSTLINKIVYNYSNCDKVITTSNLPSTTIDKIEVVINDSLTLIDTPGLLDKGDIINFVEVNQIKKIIPTREIKPITYQIKQKQSLYIDDLFLLSVDAKNDFTFYISNNLKINRLYKDITQYKNFKKNILYLDDNSDIVIQGLGFIKVVKKCVVAIYVKEGANVFVRKALI